MNVLITGASRGIGKAIAIQFAMAGHNLVITCQNSRDELEIVAKNITDKYGVRVVIFVGNMGDFDCVAQLRDLAESQLGAIDVVVNNAGRSVVGLFTDMTPVEWDELIKANLSSAFYVSQAFAKGMIIRQSGCIINISSMWGRVGASCEVAYSATKGAMDAMTKAMAKELAPSHIRVNAVSCGVIDTTMNGHLSEDEKQELAESIPAGRFGSPEEVAALCLKLVEAPEYMTGQIIGIDGGFI